MSTLRRASNSSAWLVVLSMTAFVLIPVAANADVVLDWNRLALTVPSAVGPPQARQLAMVHVAMHDAINSITREYQPYGPRIEAAAKASAEAAGVVAAHRVLTTVLPAGSAAYDAALASAQAAIGEPGWSLGAQVGLVAADNVLAMRLTDGFTTPATYNPGSGPGIWVPPTGVSALLPGFGRVVPFALHRGDQFRPDGPPPLWSKQYAADVNEVQLVGSSTSEALGLRTFEQSATARFWVGNSIPIFQGIARQLSELRQLGLSDNAQLFALLSIAGVDAYIASWDAKYTFNFWRPINAIRNADLDGNRATVPDPAWTPLAPTPPFPDYVSGHTTYTGAFVHVLEHVFGTGAVTFTATNPNVPPPEQVRTYRRIRALGTEMIEARILAGIHFRTADRDGDRLGRQVAQFATSHVLRPARGHFGERSKRCVKEGHSPSTISNSSPARCAPSTWATR